eukprot:SAG31_NODE_4180_length_3498_cov_4.884378_1_plen_740_part_00
MSTADGNEIDTKHVAMVAGEELLKSEWPFEARWLDSVETAATESNREEGVWAYRSPSQIWERMRLGLCNAQPTGSLPGTELPLPTDLAGLEAAMSALDVHGACVLRGDAAVTAACTELARALSAECPSVKIEGCHCQATSSPRPASSRPAATAKSMAKSVAQRFVESHPLIAHPSHMKLCAGALGRQLLRIASLEELRARMCPPSIFTDGASFKQLPFELDYARALRTKPTKKLTRPCLGAHIIPAVHDLENQLTCFWALDKPAAIRFAPGSHRWPLGRDADERDESQLMEVVLNPGDSLLCASGLRRRMSSYDSLVLEVGYHLAFWQTEEENQMAFGSPQAALELAPHVSRLVGWCKPGAILNKQYSGGQRQDPLGATRWLGGRSIDWARPVWNSQTVGATPESLKVANDNWCCPHAFRDSIPWAEYPSRFGKLELPPSEPSVLTSIKWPGSSASTEEVVFTVEQCLGILERDGAVILANAIEMETVDALLESIRPYSEQGHSGMHEHGVVGCLVARSTAVLPLVAHPCVMGVCEGVLGRQVLTMDGAELQRRLRVADPFAEGETRIPWQLHVQACTSKRPGEQAQQLHRDGDYVMVALPRGQIEHEVSVIWAAQDFSNGIGATRVVKGSHRWPHQRKPMDSEWIGAEMPKGSCVMYVGHTLHGAGENTSNKRRRAMNFDYIPRFLKAENHMALETPPTIARYLPGSLLELVGYRNRAEVEDACRLRSHCDRTMRSRM